MNDLIGLGLVFLAVVLVFTLGWIFGAVVVFWAVVVTFVGMLILALLSLFKGKA